MALVTHGTTLEGFKAIMAGNGKCTLGPAPWTVSDNDGCMYFFDVKSVGADYGHDIEEEQTEAIQVTCNQSFEAARLQYAVQGKGGQVVVLVCDVPDQLLELDYSCHGDSDAMPNARAIGETEFDPAWIVDIRVAEFDQWDCVAALLCVWGNDLFNRGSVPERLVSLVNTLDNGNNWELAETLYEYSLESVDVKEFIANNA
ncbi:hypothetical protein Kassivere_00106 [Pseudomonas phage vB_PpuM-Kassivere]